MYNFLTTTDAFVVIVNIISIIFEQKCAER